MSKRNAIGEKCEGCCYEFEDHEDCANCGIETIETSCKTCKDYKAHIDFTWADHDGYCFELCKEIDIRYNCEDHRERSIV